MQCKSFLWGRFFVPMFVFCALALCTFISPTWAQAQSVYEKQSPMTERELVDFIRVLPQFRAWASSQGDVAHPSISQGKADFFYSKEAEKWVKERHWDARRFFAVMGKAAASLYVLSVGGSDKARPKDMPHVSQAELDLVQKHLTNLLEAGKNAPPMAQ